MSARLFELLCERMAGEEVGLDEPVTIAELHRRLLPYRACREVFQFATKAEYYQLTNQRSRAQAYFDSLLVELERLPPEQANDPVLNTFLGLAYAGLNRTAEAIERAQALAEYIAASDDALTASLLGHRLVWIYAWVGEYDMAIDQIERLLTVPSLVSTAYLRVEAFPSGLREHPRYLRLLAGSS